MKHGYSVVWFGLRKKKIAKKNFMVDCQVPTLNCIVHLITDLDEISNGLTLFQLLVNLLYEHLLNVSYNLEHILKYALIYAYVFCLLKLMIN